MNFWRFQWLLYAFVAFILAGPYLLMRGVDQRVQAADQMRAHSREVESTAAQLLFQVRDLESAAATMTANIDAPNVRRRVVESEQAINPLLRKLVELTQDNPRQQLQVGELKTRIEQREQLSMRIINTPNAATRKELLAMMVNEFPMRNAAVGVLKEEQRLLDERTRQASKLRLQGERFSLIAVLVQLMLLSVLLWMALRHQRERALAEQKASSANLRALTVMQSIREPIALIDEEQRVVMHNAAFDELYGDGDDGTPIDGVAIGEIGGDAWTGREINQRLRDVLSRGRELWDFEIKQTTRDGIERTMLLSARPMSLPDRTGDVALLTLSDISTQKASELEISELNQQLEGKIVQVSDVNRELEAFSYSVSHDLRAPLRHISGFADKLKQHLGDGADERSRHYIATIDNSAKRMASLIDDLLVYSRLGRSALRLQAVDMQSLVDETRALLDANVAADTPGRRIEWNVAPLPMVISDENMMRQVWLNLMGNAVKYSGPRERTVIDISHRRLDDGRHEFTVKDNGVGFDMQYAGKLFGVFQRMHKATEFQGTGIGLASVQRVLMRHGGQISAESEVDRGSTFRFTLPAMLDNPSPALPAPH